MSTKTVFCISDHRMVVFNVENDRVDCKYSFDYKNQLDCERFSAQFAGHKNTKNYVLFDVSCDDYHVDQMPHVTGRDKALLLKRKIEKYFPSGEYVHAELLQRLKKGRRDDIYALSGISDATQLQPAVNLIAENKIEITGAYTTPLLMKPLIKPVVHGKQVLIVCGSFLDNGDYVLRETFLDNEHLYLSRQVSVHDNKADVIAEQLKIEIERTWQYLNNRKALSFSKDLQVLLLLPEELENAIKLQPVARHCDYQYVDNNELYSRHNCNLESSKLGFEGLVAQIVTKSIIPTHHYKPELLHAYHKLERIKRAANKAVVVVVLMTLGMLLLNINNYLKENKDFDRLNNEALQAEIHLTEHLSEYNYTGPSHQKMKSLVGLVKTIDVHEAQPGHVFNIISREFSLFDELMLLSIKWGVSFSNESGINVSRGNLGMGDNTTLDNNMSDNINDEMSGSNSSDRLVNSDSRANINVTIKGLVRPFDGDYRMAIQQIELLTLKLKGNPAINQAVATELPLNIDPTAKTSRTIKGEKPPSFAINLTLNSGVLNGGI